MKIEQLSEAMLELATYVFFQGKATLVATAKEIIRDIGIEYPYLKDRHKSLYEKLFPVERNILDQIHDRIDEYKKMAFIPTALYLGTKQMRLISPYLSKESIENPSPTIIDLTVFKVDNPDHLRVS